MPAHDARDTLKHSPNPLPEQPRAAGHVCLPTIPREQSRLESLGRSLGTVRSYISSVRRASATPSTPIAPALGSRARPRPLSYTAPGSSSLTVGFLPAPATASVFAQASRPPRNAAGPNVFEDDDVYPTPEDMLVGTPAIGMSAVHEALPEDDGIVWAAFHNADGKRLLILVYEAGLAVWDVSDLTGVREILNLRNDPLIGNVLSAVVLRPSSTFIEWKGHVLLAIAALIDDMEQVIIYSLRTHQIVKQFILPGATEIVAGNRYIVVATSQPALHIFTPTLEPWAIIPGAALATNSADGDNHPVFALQERLLAFSSTPPAHHIRTQLYNGCGYVSAAPSSALDRASTPMSSYYGMGMGALGAIASTAGVLANTVGSGAGALASTVQAHARSDDNSITINLGSPSVPGFAGMARRVGEGMWSGIRALASTTAAQPGPASSHRHSSSLGDRSFSKSAPATSGLSTAVGGEPPSPTTARGSLPRDAADASPSPGRGKAHFVTVVDLARLPPGLHVSAGQTPAHLASASPLAAAIAALDLAVVARMDLSTHHAIVKLAWDSSGTMLAVAGADGGVVRVFGGRWTRSSGTVRSLNAVAPAKAKLLERSETKQQPSNKLDGTQSPAQKHAVLEPVAPLPPAAVDYQDDGPSSEPFVNSESIQTADVGLDVPEVDLITFSAPSSVPSAATALSSSHALASAAPTASPLSAVPEPSPVPPPSSSAPLSKAARRRAKAAAAVAALEPTPPAEVSAPLRAPSTSASPTAAPTALPPLAAAVNGGTAIRTATPSSRYTAAESLPTTSVSLGVRSSTNADSPSSTRAPPGTSAPAVVSSQPRSDAPTAPASANNQPRLPALNTVAASLPPGSAEQSSLDPEMQVPVHLYDLRRGYTSATLRDLGWAFDGRWVAVGSGRGTVHVFAANPYGGKPDERSHLEGVVRNITELQPPSTEIRPIARLRSSYAPSHAFSRIDGRLSALPTEGTSPPTDSPNANASYSRGTVAIAFLHRSDVPPILLPHHIGTGSGGTPSSTSPSQAGRFQSSSASPSSRHLNSGTTSSPPLGTKFGHPSQNFQDVLVFDQLSATLTLWRLNVTLKAESESGLSGIGATLATGSAALAGTTPSTLRGEEIIIANWPLGRGHDWPEVREPINPHLNLRGDGADLAGEPRWLAQAELSTHTMERGLVPPSIYLSHQFRFSALKEDFHALIRQTQLDLPTADIQARRIRVQPAHSGHRNGTDLEGGPAVGSLGDIHAVDEAMREHLDVESGAQTPLLPMLPNGAPRTTLQAGLGRLRREIRQLRSPHLTAHSGHGAPDMDDLQEDDFFDPDDDTNTSASINTPNTRATELPGTGGHRRPRDELADSLDGSYGWDNQDDLALEEAEMFDEISPAGIMDEELAALDHIRSGRTAAKHASGGGYA